MNAKFDSFMIAELRQLLSDLEHGVMSANLSLRRKVESELRQQHEAQRK